MCKIHCSRDPYFAEIKPEVWNRKQKLVKPCETFLGVEALDIPRLNDWPNLKKTPKKLCFIVWVCFGVKFIIPKEGGLQVFTPEGPFEVLLWPLVALPSFQPCRPPLQDICEQLDLSSSHEYPRPNASKYRCNIWKPFGMFEPRESTCWRLLVKNMFSYLFIDFVDTKISNTRMKFGNHPNYA